jgi:hypothetical protein
MHTPCDGGNLLQGKGAALQPAPFLTAPFLYIELRKQGSQFPALGVVVHMTFVTFNE